MEAKKLFAVVGTDARQAAAGRVLKRAGYAVGGAEQVALADYILLPLPLDAARTPSPVYSANVEIGELDGSAGHGKTASDASACLVWLDPEEVFSMDTVIFRGVVRNLRYYTVTAGGTELSYTVASVEVTSSLRGDLAKGDICGVLYLGALGRLSTSIAGDLEDLEIGSEAIFMPFWATEETGWRDGEAYFCYADLAEFYLSEGIRFLFLDTGDGLSFARDVYTDIADAKTLDEVEDYIRDMLTEL